MRGGWNPWRALRARRHLELRWAWFTDGTRGCIEDSDDGRIVTLSAGLDQVQRRATLAHELVHDERGLLPHDCPSAIRVKDEHAVRAEVARRLVPPTQLVDFVTGRAELGEPVTVIEVAAEFEVPERVAEVACRDLSWQDSVRAPKAL